ncbi:Bax inhibitor-1/YccA family protein [Weissella diestrammenae]|uniref:Bax inhibitor-1/YccA family protein n=1 Tax=Weissella diestrammenae TaxID=1162633 RepID=A0A7G9T5K4_9LACO|nr:Bax inhibitor-1/YccA family protein [Weissella diestrammenae]MCM0582206.1 Bax inhibitor-1/YccA family protein [Weissella diestrammenae]QNN75379.1 Bax inhibitor-1/YccA family protein [Weissella diestrammenae]
MDNFSFNHEEPRIVNPDASGLNAFFRKVYSFMGMALLVTAASSFLGVTVFAKQVIALTTGLVPSLIMFALLMGIGVMAARATMSNPGRAFGLLMAYSVLMGVFLTTLFMMMNLQTIFAAFITTAALFGGMATYGLVTRRDMTKMSSLLFGSVIALVVGGLINLFFFNSIVYLAISVIGVVVFALMTAYDMNKLKQMYYQVAGQQTAEQGVAVYGALTLYLDFINLFIYILRLFGIFGNQD